MAIISFDKDAVVDYVPSYGGNRLHQGGDDNPCIVRVKYVPYSRVQYYARILNAKTQGEKDLSKIAEITQGVQEKQFIDNVESVSGYFINDDEVTDAKAFYTTADTDLVLEIIRAMESQSKLSDGQRKNS